MARRRGAKIESTYKLLRFHAQNETGVSSLWYVVHLAITLENTIRASANKMYVSIGRKALLVTYQQQKGPKIESGVVANSVLRQVSSVVWDAGQLAQYANLETLNSVEASLQKALKDVQNAQSERPETAVTAKSAPSTVLAS